MQKVSDSPESICNQQNSSVEDDFGWLFGERVAAVLRSVRVVEGALHIKPP